MNIVTRQLLLISSCVFLVLGAGAASAVDGVIEISHTGVNAAGGYPFTISASGSYVLTSNLSKPMSAVGALIVTAPNVTIDLNGFSITGTGPILDERDDGIDASSAEGLTVLNGSISTMGGAAISAGAHARIVGVRMTDNTGILTNATVLATQCVIRDSFVVNGGGIGISASQCKIEGNLITNNQGDGILGSSNLIVNNEITNNGSANLGGGGILSFSGSTIRGNVISDNDHYGVSDSPQPSQTPIPQPPPELGARNRIVNNVISRSGGVGIFMSLPSLISDNAITGSSTDGVICGSGCIIRSNQVESNNPTGYGSGGLTVGAGSVVNDNTIVFNTGTGLIIDVTSAYSNNTLSGNTVRDVDTPLPSQAHPTSGFSNLCSGVPGPAPSCP